MLARRSALSFSTLGSLASSKRVRPGISANTHHSFHTSSKMSSNLRTITTKNASPVAGPYSQAVVAGGSIFVSGQLPADLEGNLVEGSIGVKTSYCIANIKAILEEAGSDISKVVKVNVFLDSMDNFAGMNAEYEKHFTHKPARSTVAVKQLPKGVPVEIECVALA